MLCPAAIVGFRYAGVKGSCSHALSLPLFLSLSSRTGLRLYFRPGIRVVVTVVVLIEVEVVVIAVVVVVVMVVL